MGSEYDGSEPDLSTALSALREGDLDAAEAIARRLFGNAPDDPAVHQLAAVIALQRGEIQRAVRSATASLARRPDHVPTLVIAGRAARAAEDLAGAAAFFRRAAILAPDRADAAFLACVTLLELGDPEAGALLPRLLNQFPDDPEGWRLLGATLERADQSEAALLAFTRAAHTAPSVALHLRRGVLLESLGAPLTRLAPIAQLPKWRPINPIHGSSSVCVCAGSVPTMPPRRLSEPLRSPPAVATPGSQWLLSGRTNGTLHPRPKPIVELSRFAHNSRRPPSISAYVIRKMETWLQPKRLTGLH